MQLLGSRDGGGGGGHDSTTEYADAQAAPSAPAQRRAPAQAPRPPVDPDLDAAPDDIPFKAEKFYQGAATEMSPLSFFPSIVKSRDA